jgi:hypothetical protein
VVRAQRRHTAANYAGRRGMKGHKELAWNWQGPRLYIGTKTVAVIVPDAVDAGMWRVRRGDGSLSDMSNITRARDAAMAMVLRELNTGKTAPEAPRSDSQARTAAPG